MPYFYAPPENIKKDVIIFQDEESHHIKDVLRKKPGDSIWVTDGEGRLWLCVIEKSFKKRVEAKIIQEIEERNDPEEEITLAAPIPKGKRIDFMIEKATELGIRKFRPLITQRSEIETCKRDRLRRIAISAIKQSERTILPEIEEPTHFGKVLEQIKNYDIAIMGFKESKEILDGIIKGKKKILVIVGPEGGFTQEEYESALKCGIIPVTLGKTTLRIETAAIALLSIIMNEITKSKKERG